MTRREAVLAAAGVTLAVGVAEAAEVWDRQWRLLDTKTGRDMRPRDLPGRLAQANVIFVGEQHDDPETHRVELYLLREMHKKLGSRLTLAMEMFERDGQTALSDYLAGKITEEALGKAVRLWRNYPTDYRPLIEFSRENRIPVLGSNAPGRLVRKVGQEGLAALAGLSPEERALVSSYVNAPEGDLYATRFASVIGQGHGDGKMDSAMVRRFYEAQCVRDDTMAESIAVALDRGGTVLHINGSFHSDAGLGTAARLLWRRPLLARIAVVKVVPYTGAVEAEPLRAEADYLIFVPDKRPAKKEG